MRQRRRQWQGLDALQLHVDDEGRVRLGRRFQHPYPRIGHTLASTCDGAQNARSTNVVPSAEAEVMMGKGGKGKGKQPLARTHPEAHPGVSLSCGAQHK